MSATLFHYYDDWKNAILTCPKCGWTGKIEEGDIEYFNELFDCSCPKCVYPDSPMLAIVSYPTIQESRQNWDKVSERDRAAIEYREVLQDRWNKMSLKSSEELPDIEEEEIVIDWDVCEYDSWQYVVLSYKGKRLWMEPAFYEDYHRFKDVVNILKEKYGKHLKDVVPTRASWYHLYGDKLSAPDIVDNIRNSLKS